MKKQILTVLVLFCTIILTACSEIDAATAANVNIEDFLVISHRGVSEAPDHSFEGYDLAIEQGSLYIEQDVFLSKDGYMVISHDNEIADGMKITEMTFDEIRGIEKENGELYLTLEEVFERYGNTVNYVIENKFTDENFILEQKMLDLVKEHNLENNVVFQSFHSESLGFFYEKDTNAPLMLLVNENKNTDALINFENYNYVDIFTFVSIMLNEENIATLHEANIKTCVYFSGETDEERQRTLELGIDGLFTDYTERTFEMIEEINA